VTGTCTHTHTHTHTRRGGVNNSTAAPRRGPHRTTATEALEQAAVVAEVRSASGEHRSWQLHGVADQHKPRTAVSQRNQARELHCLRSLIYEHRLHMPDTGTTSAPHVALPIDRPENEQVPYIEFHLAVHKLVSDAARKRRADHVGTLQHPAPRFRLTDKRLRLQTITLEHQSQC
jgi:hypothetical protein